jgi:predicted Zn-dependent peptidase
VSTELSDTKLGSVRVVSESQPHSKSVSIGIWVKVGSRDEPEGLWGCSHFLEHMLFKGTDKRTAEEISATIEKRGGYLNAYTDRDMTAYHARVMDRDLGEAFDVLQDIAQNSALRDADIENERQVVLEEIKQLEDDPAGLIHELSMGNVWSGSSLAHSILGTVESISNVSTDQLRGYYDELYSGELIVAAAGAVNHEELVGLVEGSVQGRRAKTTHTRATPAHRSGVIAHPRETSQVQLSISAKGLPYGHRDAATLAIISSYLGAGASSRLFQEVREKRGLVYAIYTHNTSLEDAGVMEVYAGTRSQNVAQVVGLILEELDKVTGGLDEAVLEEEKHKTLGSFILRSESNQQRVNQLGVSTLRLGRPQTVDEVVDRLRKVTNEDVVRVSGTLFDRKGLSLTALGLSERESAALSLKLAP